MFFSGDMHKLEPNLKASLDNFRFFLFRWVAKAEFCIAKHWSQIEVKLQKWISANMNIWFGGIVHKTKFYTYMHHVIDMKFCVCNLYMKSCKVQSCKIFLEADFGGNPDISAEIW